MLPFSALHCYALTFWAHKLATYYTRMRPVSNGVVLFILYDCALRTGIEWLGQSAASEWKGITKG